MGSIPPAESIEHPQREIVNFIKDSAIAPIAEDLHQLARSAQSQKVVYAEDFGIPNSYLIDTVPVIAEYKAGQRWNVKIKNTNNGPSILNANQIGPREIVKPDGSPLVGYEMAAGAVVGLIDDGSKLQLQAAAGGGGGGGSSGLTAIMHYYVNFATGDDELYDGTVAVLAAGTKHGPFKTVQRAITETLKWNMNNYSVEIHVADYAPGQPPFTCYTLNGAGTCYITGNLTTPANCHIHNPGGEAILVLADDYVIKGFKVSCAGNGPNAPVTLGIGLRAFGGLVKASNFDFGYCAEGHMSAQAAGGGIIWLGAEQNNPGGFINVSGSAARFHMNAQAYGWIHLGLPDLNVLAAVSMQFWALAHSLGNIGYHYRNMSGHGGVSAQKFWALSNGVIVTSDGQSASYYPGNVAGVLSYGGQYF